MNLQDLVGQIKSQPRLLIRFHASWCGVCKLLAPHVESLKQNDAYADVTFVDVDVEENLDVKEAFKINDLPYFAGFKEGKLLEEFATAKKDRVTELTDAVASGTPPKSGSSSPSTTWRDLTSSSKKSTPPWTTRPTTCPCWATP